MNDDLGARLGATLREQAPEQLPSLSLEAIASDARRIRTRRRGAVAGAAALTVALAVGVPYALIQNASDVPAPSTPGDKAPVVTLQDDAPRSTSSYGSWITPDVPLDVSGPWNGLPTQVTRVGQRTLVVDTDADGVDRAWLFDPRGDVEWQGIVRQEAVHAMEAVAVITEQGELTVFGTDGDRLVLARGLSATSRLVSMEMQPECIDGGAAGPCYAVVTDDGVEAPPRVFDVDGTVRTIDGVPSAHTTDVGSNDRVAVRTPGTGTGKEQSFCTSLVLLDGLTAAGTEPDEDPDRVLWSRCGTWMLGFGADGYSILLAEEAAVGDGIGPSRVGIADEETGKVRTWLAAPGGFIKDVEPYSLTSFQVSSYSYETQRWSLHSFDSETGELEQIADPVKASDTESPFLPIEN